MKLPALRTLPKPLKLVLAALGVYVAFKVLVTVLIVLSIAVSLIWTAAVVALLAAVVYAVLRRR